jgi:filamentous hemagglutinin
MNKNRYRVIFSKVKTMFIVVAENAKSHTKASGETTASEIKYETDPVAFHQLWQVKSLIASLSLFMAFSPVYAEIQVDHSAPANKQAVIGLGQNQQGQKVAVVNISTPQSGVSHNVYTQFDVPKEGVVLNNSRSGAATQTGGQVAANPFLQSGDARLILNEVNSNAPSALEGNLEVAGRLADVVIANPSGINVKGAGFINTHQIQLVAGKPQINTDGSIQQFVIDQGKVNISSSGINNLGLGGNNNNPNYASIYAKAIELNAEVYAKDGINIVAGSNNLYLDKGPLDVVPVPNAIPQPNFAIDVKALGAMYANDIYLVATEKGLGVSNAGKFFSTNNINIDTFGKVVNTGEIINKSSKVGNFINISSRGADIVSKGTIESNGEINLKSNKSILIDQGNILTSLDAPASNILLAASDTIDLTNGAQIKNKSNGYLFLKTNKLNINNLSNMNLTGSLYTEVDGDLNVDNAVIGSNSENINFSAKNINIANSKNITALNNINIIANNKSTISNSTFTSKSNGNINIIDQAEENVGKDISITLTVLPEAKVTIKDDQNNVLVTGIADKDGHYVYNTKSKTSYLLINQTSPITGLTSADAKYITGINLPKTIVSNSTFSTMDGNVNILTKSTATLDKNNFDNNINVNINAKENVVLTNSINSDNTTKKGALNISSEKNVTLDNVKTNNNLWDANIAAQGNLTWNNPAAISIGNLDLKTNGKLDLSNTSLNANSNISLLGSEVVAGQEMIAGGKIDITSYDADLILANHLQANSDINVSAIKGRITALSLNLNSINGEISILANKDVGLYSNPINTAQPLVDEIKTKKTNITANKSITIGSTNEGMLLIQSADIKSTQGGINLIGGNGIDIQSNIFPEHPTDFTSKYEIPTNLEAQSIVINSQKNNINIKNTDLKSNSEGIHLQSGGALSLIQSRLNSAGNTEIFANENIYLQNVNLTSQQHAALNSKDVISFSGNANTNGILSITTDKGLNLQNAQLNGGAVSIEAKNIIKDKTNINAKESDILKNDEKLKDINGNLSIQTIDSLVINPNDISAFGNIDLKSTNDNLNIKTDLTSENGSIHLNGKSVEIDAKKIYAKNGIDITSTNGDINIKANKNPLNNSNIQKADFGQTYGDANTEFQLFLKNNPEYQTKFNALKSEIFDCYFVIAIKPTDGNINFYTAKREQAEKDLLALNMQYGATNLYNRTTFLLDEYNSLFSKTRTFSGLKDGMFIKQTEDHSSSPISGYMHDIASLVSDGNINLSSSSGILLNSTNINSTGGDVSLYAQGNVEKSKTSLDPNNQVDASIILANIKDQYILGNESDPYFQKIDINRPNTINGENINIISNNKPNLNVLIQASDLKAKEGINILATGNIDLLHSVDNIYSKNYQSTTKESWWGLNKKTTSTLQTVEGALGRADTLNANKINIESLGGNISLYGTKVTAPKDTVKLKAANDIKMLTFQDQVKEATTVKKDSNFLGIDYRDSNSVGSKLVTTQIPTVLTANYIATSSGGNTYLQGTQFNFTDGVYIKAGDGPNPSPDAKIIITTANDQYISTVDQTKNSTLWQSMGSKGTSQDFATLPKFNGPVSNVKIEGDLSIQVPVQAGDNREVIDVINDLANKPGYEYLKTLVNNPDQKIDWSALQLTKKDWDYKQQGLTPAGAAIVTIIVTALTSGTGSSVSGALGFSSSAATTSATQAAIASLSSQISISLINNGGDVGKTLKELGSKDSVKSLLNTIVTAGLLQSIGGTNWMQQFSGTGLTDRVVTSLINSTGASLVNATINGGDLETALKQALLTGIANGGQSYLSTQIKILESNNIDLEYALHKIAHAVTGCITASVGQKSCEAGALGASLAEVIGEMLIPQSVKPTDLSPAEQEKIKNISKLIVGTVSAFAGFDVNTAVNSAQISLDNNLFFKDNFKFKPLDKQTIDKIRILKENGQYAAAYQVVYSNIVGDPNVPDDIKYWFQQAIKINSNADNSAANDFIRIFTQKGLEYDGIKIDAAQLQATSNLIAKNVTDDIINSGGVNSISTLLSRDIYAALEQNHQTMGGWAGSIYYWNLKLDSGKYAGKTVGEVISGNNKDLIKNNTIFNQTVNAIVSKYGWAAVKDILSFLGRGDVYTRQIDLLLSPIGRQ